MRILLAANASYLPPRGGSTRSNLVWLRALARAGHECRIVSPAPDPSAGDDRVEKDGLTIVRIAHLSRHAKVVRDEIEVFQPDWVLVSSEDLSRVLLREAFHAAPGSLIYLAHTPQFFPFGPESWNPDSEATDIIRSARAVIAIGHHVAGYINQHAGVRATVIHPPIYGSPPFPRYGRFGSGVILTINPCDVKGIAIFLAVAERCPGYRFEGLTGWGTTRRDLERMSKLPNVSALQPVADIGEALSRASLLLMPSLWYEGFGLIAMEAMLGGLPVVASNSGGLVEAKRGTGYVIPVRPIEQYKPEFDENHMPRPVLPEQDIEPWESAVRTLMSDQSAWEREAERSRAAAEEFASGLRVEEFEKLLLSLKPAGPTPRAKVRAENLTPAQRALLFERLRRRKS